MVFALFVVVVSSCVGVCGVDLFTSMVFGVLARLVEVVLVVMCGVVWFICL